MASIFPAYIQAHPSYTMPELVLQYQQVSGFTEALAGGDIMPRLGQGDLQVYVKGVEVRTQIAAGQTAYNMLPSQTVEASMKSTPTYLMRARAEYDHHDIQQAGVWGVSLADAQRLAMRQAIFQQIRTAALFGMGGAAEGILNTVGATTANLPADSNGNTTVSTYDNGQMALYLISLISALKVRTNQIGQPVRINIMAPQRAVATWEYQGIVQLTQFQRNGAGVETTAGVVENILERNGDQITFTVDDTLINAGSGGTTDAIIINMPELKKPAVRSRINTNVFADLSPGMTSATIQLCDMVAPKEITVPLPGGAVDVLSEMRVTPGWVVRPETVTILSAGF